MSSHQEDGVVVNESIRHRVVLVVHGEVILKSWLCLRQAMLRSSQVKLSVKVIVIHCGIDIILFIYAEPTNRAACV